MLKLLSIIILITINLFASIDISKNAITIITSNSLNNSKYVAKSLTNYDIYLKKIVNEQNRSNYIIYTVNIDESIKEKSLKQIQDIFPLASPCSLEELKQVVSTNRGDDVFIHKSMIKMSFKELEKDDENFIEPKKIIKKNKNFIDNSNKSIKIALVIQENQERKAVAIHEALKLAMKEINSNGGIQNHKLELLLFDDKNKKEVAKQQALKAVESDAVIVLGHRTSSMSIAGGEIYKKHKIPAITGSAMSDLIVKDNPWFFRTIQNNSLQTNIIAYYIKYILKKKKIYLISESGAYGENIYDTFIKYAKEVDLDIVKTWKFDWKSKNLEKKAKKIVRELARISQDGVLFLATNDKRSIPFIYNIRKKNLKLPIFGTGTIGKTSYPARFSKYPLEKAKKGYYSDHILTPSFMLYDIAGVEAIKFVKKFKKMFGKKPDSINAVYYDTLNLIAKALKKVDLNQDKKNIRSDLRDEIADINNFNKSYIGVTGMIYFKEGELQRKPYIAEFIQGNLLSSQLQINKITNLALDNYINNSKLTYSQLKKEYPNLLRIKSGFLMKKEIIRIGFKLYKISEIDILKKTARLNFDIWMIDRGEISLNELYFTNAIDKIKFDLPYEEKITVNGIYQRYRIDAKFNLDFDTTKFKVNQHLVGFTLAVKTKSNKKLILVPDISNIKYSFGESFVENIKKEQIFSDNSLKIREANFYSSNKNIDSLANPSLTQIGIFEYKTSNINLFITFDTKSFDGNSYIDFKQSIYIILISLLFLFLLIYFRIYLNKQNIIYHKYELFINFLFFIITTSLVYIILFALEVFILNIASTLVERTILEKIAIFINIIWVLVNATLINNLMLYTVWNPMERKTNKPIPMLLKNMISFLVYIIAFLIMYKYILLQDLTSLLASMGVLAMVIGFAIQANINNIFSGLALNIENTVDVGDWIEFIGYPEGKVKDINWRTTTVICRDRRVVNIPNAIASESPLTNFSKSEKLMQTIIIGVNLKYNPDEIKLMLLNTMVDIEGILQNPKPLTGIKEIYRREVRYKLLYFIDKYENRFKIEEQIWSNIWLYLQKSNIKKK